MRKKIHFSMDKHKRRRYRATLGLVIVVGGIIPMLIGFCSPYISTRIIVAMIGDILDPSAKNIEMAEGISVSEFYSVENEGYPDSKFKLIRRDLDEKQPLLFYIHGGGFVCGSADSSVNYLSYFAKEGYTVATLEYTLAPYAAYPTPVVQAVSALNDIINNASSLQIDETKVIIGGDSAGAQIASQVCSLVTNETLRTKMGIEVDLSAQQLKGAMLNCGVYDIESLPECEFPFGGTFLWAYTNTYHYQEFEGKNEFSTVKNITSAFPKTYLTDGDSDWLLPQTMHLKEKLEEKGVPVMSYLPENKGLGHDYQLDLLTDEGKKVYQDMLQFMKGAVSGE